MKRIMLTAAGLLLSAAFLIAKTETPKPDALIEIRVDQQGRASDIKIAHLASYVSRTKAEKAVRRLQLTNVKAGATVTLALSAEMIDSLTGSTFDGDYPKASSPRIFSMPDPDHDFRSVPRT